MWTYDDAGNIQNKKEYAYTTGNLGTPQKTVSYTYDSSWGDLLTGYNGKTVTSDTIGNILSDGTRTYTWKHGRQLATTEMSGKTWTYTYNAEGMRTKRVSGNASYTYYYNGDLLRYVDYDSNTTDSNQAAKLYFVLDANGNPIEVSYRPEGSTTTKFYYYVQNLQGDVIALVDSANGNTVVTYTYDAWGNVLSTNGSLATTLGVLNPFRYRGYVYDSETKLFYLQSRYYDPEIGRFINADAFASTGQGILGNNMFAYCLNNPVNYVDMNGCLAKKVTDPQQIQLGETETQTESNPKDSPPDHPDFKPPKKGNQKKRNPNGNGWGWVDDKGNVWVWNPNMHGGKGWVVQKPNGGHSHAYPGGGTRTHLLGKAEHGNLISFPALPQELSTYILPLIPVAIMIGVATYISFDAESN